MKWLLPIVFIFLISGAQVKRQFISPKNKKNVTFQHLRAEPQNQKVLNVIRKVEQGIQTNTIGVIEHDFSAMISVSIGSTERGYVSANQVISMLKNYFSNRRPVSFEFSRINDKGAAPYATGRLVYIQKGNQESAQIYIALTYEESRWVINQLNIY
jgi:hypothetical protein